MPEHWKVANLIPIYKNVDKNKPENNPSVNLTSIACKYFGRNNQRISHRVLGETMFHQYSIFTLSPEVSRFKYTNNTSQLYHTDINVQVLIAFNN